ncbi:MAG: hypothetical protein EBX30_16495 [Betaproteobacteria bacterium]|nr:hypothetical protein [Betaproteobacteria bacterium]
MEFFHQNFHQKNKNKKTRKASELSTENRKSFFLFFYTFSILSIFGALETAWFKNHFFRVKNHFFRVKNHLNA